MFPGAKKIAVSFAACFSLLCFFSSHITQLGVLSASTINHSKNICCDKRAHYSHLFVVSPLFPGIRLTRLYCGLYGSVLFLIVVKACE